jgi:hypothetical protein
MRIPSLPSAGLMSYTVFMSFLYRRDDSVTYTVKNGPG